MENYNVLSKKGRWYKIDKNEEEIAVMMYEKWSNRDAEIKLNKTEMFFISADKLLSSMIEIKQGNTVAAYAEPDHKGEVIITIKNQHGSDEVFVFAHDHTSKNRYVVTNQQNEEIIVAEQEFKWRTLSYKCTLSATENIHPLLLLPITLYCVNIYRSSFVGNAAMVNANNVS